MLSYVQAGMVALCYASLIAAAWFKFMGGQPRYVIFLGLLGALLGFGSLIPGRIAKRYDAANEQRY
jgi:hypothetical protein